MAVVLSAKGLSKSYGALQAVRDISLAVNSGQCLALLGPNGAGKTTTVEILEGLIQADAGHVEIFGKDLARNRAEILQRVGVVLQETNLYKKLSVKETLQLFASFYRESRPVAELLAEMQLSDKADSRLEQLSGGQKQRVYIGCGLINRPQMVFLDEPTSGLDPQARRMIWDKILDLKKSGCAVLLTTHYMEEAETLADQVAIIDHGQIIAQASPDQLIRQHCGQHTLHFSIDEKSPDNNFSKLQSELSWLAAASRNELEENKYFVTIDNPTTSLSSLIAAAEKHQVTLDNLHLRQSDLEDVFLKLTGRSIRDN